MRAKFIWVLFCVLSAFSALLVLSALCEKELGLAIFFAVLTAILVLAAKNAEKKMKADSGKKTNVYLNEDFVKEFSEENAAPDEQTDVDKLFGGETRKPLLGGAEKTAKSPQKGDFADEVRKKIEDAQAAKKDAVSDDDDEILFSALHASERRREEMAEKNQTENLYEIVYEDAKGDVTHRKIIIKSLEERNDYYYFNAFCLLRNEDRQFAVVRILEMWQGTKRVMPSIVFRELRDKFEKEERDFVLSHHIHRAGGRNYAEARARSNHRLLRGGGGRMRPRLCSQVFAGNENRHKNFQRDFENLRNMGKRNEIEDESRRERALRYAKEDRPDGTRGGGQTHKGFEDKGLNFLKTPPTFKSVGFHGLC